MGYVKNTLAPGEEYLYRAKFNWTYDAHSWAWFLLGAAPAMVWLFQLFHNYLWVEKIDQLFTFTAGFLFAASAIYLLYRYIQRWTTVVAVTSRRLILKRG